eukprot:jgi/Chrzof1/4132/Cz14g00100.t1
MLRLIKPMGNSYEWCCVITAPRQAAHGSSTQPFPFPGAYCGRLGELVPTGRKVFLCHYDRRGGWTRPLAQGDTHQGFDIEMCIWQCSHDDAGVSDDQEELGVSLGWMNWTN